MRTLLAIAFSLFLTLGLSAQCPACTIDPSCATTLAGVGGLCPATIPDGTVGDYYEESITFFIPTNLTVSGFDVTVQNITIASLNGLPFDMNWECDNAAGGCFYDITAGENLGCVTVCGIPVTAPGTYNIEVVVNVTVYVNSIGSTVTQPQTYNVPLNILQGSGTASFNYTGMPDCASNYDVTFNATVDGSPNLTKYNWDFGNGNTSTLANPPVQSYAAPGTYQATLDTDICGYTLDEICTTSIAAESYCGDVEEPNVFVCSGSPDIYYVLYDANGVQVAGGSNTEIENTFVGCWSNLGIQLSNPPYTLEIYDYDSVSQDDLLSSSTFTPSGTTQTFSGTAGNGNTTTGVLNFGTYVIQSFNDVATIGAFDSPLILAFNTTDVSVLGGSDGMIDLTVSGGTGPYTYFWGAQGTTEDLTNIPAGIYAVQVTDANGCTAIATVEIFEPALPPCATNLFLSGPVTNSEIHSAIDVISSTAMLSGGIIVDYHAGDYVELANGFEIQAGVEFDAYILECQ